MYVKTATAGALGFDINQPLTGAQYAEFVKNGYSFCIRYIPRTPELAKGNLTFDEIGAILGAGLNLSVVQHVALPGWMPGAELGTRYGEYAGEYASKIGLPKGINIWLDLEEVASNCTAQDVIDYCHAWAVGVQNAGYLASLYVGWNVKLTAAQLYEDLPFKSYWRAYNADIPVATRGYQMLQGIQKTLDGIPYDPNKTQADNMGDLPIWVSPTN